MRRKRGIDVAEAEALYAEGFDWRQVGMLLSKGRPTPFQADSVKHAVYAARKLRKANDQGPIRGTTTAIEPSRADSD